MKLSKVIFKRPAVSLEPPNCRINSMALVLDKGAAYSRTWTFRWAAGNEHLSPDSLVLMSLPPRQVDAQQQTPLAITYWLDTNSIVNLDMHQLGAQLETIGQIKPIKVDAQQSQGYQIVAPVAPKNGNSQTLPAGAYKFSISAMLNDPVCGSTCPVAVLDDDFDHKPEIKEFTFSSQLNPVLNQPLELEISLDEPGQLLFQVGIEDGALFAEPLFWKEYKAGDHTLTWDGRAEGTPYMLTPERYFYVVYQLALFDNAFMVYGNENSLKVLTEGALSVNPENLSPVRVDYKANIDSIVTAKLVDETTDWDNPLGVLVQDQSLSAGAQNYAQWNGLIDGQPAPQGIYTIAIRSVSQSDPTNVVETHRTVGVRSPIMRVKNGTLYIVPNPGEIVYNVTQTDDAATQVTTTLAESTIPGAVVSVPIEYYEDGEHTFTATFYNTVTKAPPYSMSVTSTFTGGEAQ